MRLPSRLIVVATLVATLAPGARADEGSARNGGLKRPIIKRDPDDPDKKAVEEKEPERTNRAVGEDCKNDNQCALGSICVDAVCTALPKGKRIIPFYFHQPGEVGYRYIPPGLYFSEWDRTGKTRVQFPFFAQREDYKEQSKMSIVPPLLFWYTRWNKKGEEGKSAGAIPFFYFRQRGAQRIVALPFLFTGLNQDPKNDRTEALIGLLGYYRREKTDTWRVLFPLFFDHQNGSDRTTVAPLMYFSRTKERQTNVVFPLVWHFSDSKKGTDNLAVLPFFDWDSRDHGRRQQLISIIGGYERNDDIGRRQLVLLTPPFYHRRDKVRDLDMLPPLFFRWKIHATRASGLLAANFYYSSDPEGASASLFPIFWYFSDKKTQAKTAVLFPLALWFQRPKLWAGYIGPFYGWRKTEGAGGWGGGLFPLVYGGRSGDTRYAMVLPLFTVAHNPKEGTTTAQVGPVFVHRQKDGFHAGVVPLAFFGSTPKIGYGVVAPLVWHVRTEHSTTDVVGPVFVNRPREGGWSAGVVPLAFFGKGADGTSHQVVLPPLFVHTSDPKRQKERLLVGPFYHRRDGAETADALFPLFYLRRSPERGLFISPLAGWRKEPGKETLIVALYGHLRDDKKQSATRFVFPFWIQHSKPGLSVQVSFPLFWRIKDGDETDTAVFPFYWRVRSPRMQLDAFFPLVLHAKTARAETTLAGPFWDRKRVDGTRSMGLFPLFVYGRAMQNDKQAFRYLVMPGAVWMHDDKAGTQKLVIGPFFDTRRPDGFASGLAPLAFAWRRGSLTRALVWPLLFYHERDPAAQHHLTVFGPFFAGRDGEVRRFGLAPLLFARYSSDGRARVTMLPLFHFEKKTLGSLLITPLGGWSTYPGGKRVFFTLFYMRRDDQVSSTAIWPLVYFGHDKATNIKTHLVIPFYLRRDNGEGASISAYTPLVWRYRSVERHVIVGLPLFFDSHWYGESRATGLLPLFVRYHSRVDRQTDRVNWFFPPLLTWVRRRTGADPGTDVAILPLFYHLGGKVNSTTVVFPLIWDWKRGDTRTTVFMPIGAHWKRRDAVHTLIFNFHYERGRAEKEGRWIADIVPLFEFGRPRKNDVTFKFIYGLIGYSRLGRNRILHLFWADIALSPATPSQLGWFSNTNSSDRQALY